MSSKSKYLICIVGPTAIGKTALSIKLAQHFNTEIISADSRQFYKEMCIGTAVPSQDELNAAKHHFIQHISITDEYNVGRFEQDAIAKITSIFKEKSMVIAVGGSGLYMDSIVNGLDNFPKIDSSIRQKLNSHLDNKGLHHLQEQLKKLDLESYNGITLDNPKRVIRALEICIGTGKPYSSFLNKNDTNRNFKTIYIGLKAERDILYHRINKRVDIMMKTGLIDEVKSLQHYQELNALNTVGYKELFKYLNGDWDLNFAISEIKKNTRRFAKRQLTWYRKNESIIWFNYLTDANTIIKRINEII
ncbi:tRNA (adenosine(37)-N6)-dimethylallyltransferase MiaA [Ichthyenterobacterium sp. W332]|uniref:tRNA dimethylallyltransferase n=1 Tax=Microcosmobacter mediterraneus TaxID=3075607 RepID=A0ABU2YHD6_9FLAO|nr:tRNA (adenosine(37)-N6)-dimethylallyltransferase MiaA [Ichthyenterobacterium sp. W332]MDT0557551.1 tRNA (adenosine(37)-N6)-dimethylallyltransferase MiaA [Ichthyenterobacterium sp. W332]